MKKETWYKIGIFAAGTVALVACVKAYNTSDELNRLLKEIDKVSDNTDVDISEKMTKYAVKKAAEKAANAVAKECAENIRADVNDSVSEAVSKCVGDIRPLVQKSLERQISLVDISKMKEEVIDKAADIVADNITIPTTPVINLGDSTSNIHDLSEIIKTCNDAGMYSWEIEKIIKAAQNN